MFSQLLIKRQLSGSSVEIKRALNKKIKANFTFGNLDEINLSTRSGSRIVAMASNHNYIAFTDHDEILYLFDLRTRELLWSMTIVNQPGYRTCFDPVGSTEYRGMVVSEQAVILHIASNFSVVSRDYQFKLIEHGKVIYEFNINHEDFDILTLRLYGRSILALSSSGFFTVDESAVRTINRKYPFLEAEYNKPSCYRAINNKEYYVAMYRGPVRRGGMNRADEDLRSQRQRIINYIADFEARNLDASHFKNLLATLAAPPDPEPVTFYIRLFVHEMSRSIEEDKVLEVQIDNGEWDELRAYDLLDNILVMGTYNYLFVLDIKNGSLVRQFKTEETGRIDKLKINREYIAFFNASLSPGRNTHYVYILNRRSWQYAKIPIEDSFNLSQLSMSIFQSMLTILIPKSDGQHKRITYDMNLEKIISEASHSSMTDGNLFASTSRTSIIEPYPTQGKLRIFSAHHTKPKASAENTLETSFQSMSR